MTMQCHFIDPVDVLFLRGNKLFGDAGSYGESLVPPWPSVAAGALRSALLAQNEVDLKAFASGQYQHPELGTPEQPGPFTLTAFHLARSPAAAEGSSAGSAEPIYPLPADLVVRKQEEDSDELDVVRLQPREPAPGICCSRKTSALAVLPEQSRGKPETGYWLNADGWQHYLTGAKINSRSHLITSSELWRLETRVGVGLDAATRRASDGALFSTQAVALKKAEHSTESAFTIGFLVQSKGASFPEQFGIRLGGDGRAAIARKVEPEWPTADYQSIVESRRCRIVLTSPGIFAEGWLPPGFSGADFDWQFDLHGVRGRLSCAAVPRAEVVSGFDIARGRPKSAQRAVPTGSVYWLEALEATPEALQQLVAQGFWSSTVEDPARRAEGFNRLAIATY